ncbi:MAG: heavy-metal-associated domain-containing protein [Clostridia bacterium]|nr:heavy-metal-associated domain-containing protein [Clostridia bacterium]
MEKIVVTDMMCNNCVRRVKAALEEAGATNIEISLEEKKATFDGISKKEGIKAVKEIGFKAK